MATLKHDPQRLRKVATGIRGLHDRVTKAAAEVGRNRFKYSKLQKFRQWAGRDQVGPDVAAGAVNADNALLDATPSIDMLYEELNGFRVALFEYVAQMDKVAETCAKGVEKTASAYEKLDRSGR